ncbi:hypothetical protein OUZ56_004270 [Daphnia magna]|uniref:Uncharacterized protein n=1 Tax=Daphnia magna TaxID=35525 RepID=A0ABQ9YPD5_9CRUS|nr:hypothetical protein OUZ56_004270 [Daphnia magna]
MIVFGVSELGAVSTVISSACKLDILRIFTSDYDSNDYAVDSSVQEVRCIGRVAREDFVVELLTRGWTKMIPESLAQLTSQKLRADDQPSGILDLPICPHIPVPILMQKSWNQVEHFEPSQDKAEVLDALEKSSRFG